MIDHLDSTVPANLVAIDVAKDWNLVLVQETSGARLLFKVANRKPDHDRLITFLKSLPSRVVAAVEPTGDYHRSLVYGLLSEAIEVVSISSVSLAQVREARFGTWDKNDPKDAPVILSMLAPRMVQTYYDPLIAGTHDLQELANTYFQITLARLRLQHSRLLHYIPLYFPEFARYWNSTRSAWFIRFLLRFPTADSIREVQFETFSREAWDLIGRKVAERASLAQTYAMGAESIGLSGCWTRLQSRCFGCSSRGEYSSTRNVSNSISSTTPAG